MRRSLAEVGKKEKVQHYHQVLAQAMQWQYPLSLRDETALLRFQQQLNLTDADVATIRGEMLAEREEKVNQYRCHARSSN